MRCSKCQTENPSQFQYCGECRAPLFLAVLKEIAEESAVTSHYIFQNGATIGRHYDNAIILLDYSVSRFHARIDCIDGKFYIQDLSSSNGVFVNEVKVRRREIKDFDRIAIGKVMMLFRTGELSGKEEARELHTQDQFLAAIRDIGQNAKSAALSHQVLEIAAEFAISLTAAERAIIFVYDNNLKLQPAVFHNASKEDLARDEFEVSLSAIAEAEQSGELLIREELLNDPRYSANQSIQALHLNTIICLPLKSPHALEVSTASETRSFNFKGVLFGILYMDSRKPLKGVPQHRRTMLQVLADQTSLAIENAILQREMAEKQNLKKQLRAAKVIQQRLFPQSNFSHPKFDMAFRFKAAQQIGGDYLCFIPLSDSRFLITIGDVVGKGLPAGLVVMTLHGGLFSEISHRPNLDTLVKNLDRLIYEYTEGKVFVTFFAGIMDVDSLTLEYANAGHNPPLVHRNNGEVWRDLRATGIPLGLQPETERQIESFQLVKDDLILFYTDGITEARGKDRKQFGVGGLKKIATTWMASVTEGPLQVSALVDAIFERARHFTLGKPFDDDTTLMALAIKSGS